MDYLTEIEDESLFKFERLPVIPYEKSKRVYLDITVEMNYDLTVIARSSYTFLDLLSDIGGIQSILMSAGALCLIILNYNHFDN